eukprot:7526615-Prorocentrum_lima.AAC.1
MTSSLVGSEMCIRDRSSFSAALAKEQYWRVAPRTSKALHLAMRLHTPFPVSYTHLTLPTICSV